MAYEITVQSKQTIFNETILKSIYTQVSPDFGLAKNEVDKVIKELEGHTGLIIQPGYNDYEFAHKSIHEFLCAEHLVKLPIIPKDEKIISLLPNELAIATTISSDPSHYFCELVLNRFYSRKSGHRNFSYNTNFMTSFVNRIVLEKPDFNLSKDISFALVVLYTLFRRTDTGQLQLFEYELPMQFEKFVELIFKRNKKFEFKKYYDLDEKYKSERLEPILKLKRNTVEYKYNSDYFLPEYLFVKKSFVSGFENS